MVVPDFCFEDLAFIDVLDVQTQTERACSVSRLRNSSVTSQKMPTLLHEREQQLVLVEVLEQATRSPDQTRARWEMI